MRALPFQFLAALPKISRLIRGLIFRVLVILAGGSCGSGMRIESGFRLRHGFHNGLKFGRSVYFGQNCTIDCLPSASFAVGNNTTFTQGCFVSVAERMVIGDDVLIGEYCSLRDANHSLDNPHKRIADQPMQAATVQISNDVWIGRGVAILAGARVGEGAVVGANAVVHGIVPANTIAVGVPAKPLRARSTQNNA